MTTLLSDYRSFLNSTHGPNTASAIAKEPSGVVTEVEFSARKLPEAKNAALGVRYLPNEQWQVQKREFVEIGNENKVVRAPDLGR